MQVAFFPQNTNSFQKKIHIIPVFHNNKHFKASKLAYKARIKSSSEKHYFMLNEENNEMIKPYILLLLHVHMLMFLFFLRLQTF